VSADWGGAGVNDCDSRRMWGSDKELWSTGNSLACVSAFGVSTSTRRVNMYI
jgi:hypothetical protein